MTDTKPTRLSEVAELPIKQGVRDKEWFLMEHHLMQAKISLQDARRWASLLCLLPENAEDHELADGCYELIQEAYTGFLVAHAALLALLSDSDVSERIGNVEL